MFHSGTTPQVSHSVILPSVNNCEISWRQKPSPAEVCSRPFADSTFQNPLPRYVIVRGYSEGSNPRGHCEVCVQRDNQHPPLSFQVRHRAEQNRPDTSIRLLHSGWRHRGRGMDSAFSIVRLYIIYYISVANLEVITCSLPKTISPHPIL